MINIISDYRVLWCIENCVPERFQLEYAHRCGGFLR